MRFSLILATVDRTAEVRVFLESLSRQTFTDFELVVVDQNADSRLAGVFEEYEACFCVKWVRAPRGLSVARNAGLRHATGEIIAFPDDDCEYPQELLAEVDAYFARHQEVKMLAGKCLDRGSQLQSGTKLRSATTRMKAYNAMETAISTTLFVSLEVVQSGVSFCEGMGAGTRFGSGEETDFVLQGLARGFCGMYEPGLVVFHPRRTDVLDDRTLKRYYTYGLGLGAMLRRNIVRSPGLVVPFCNYLIWRPVAAAAVLGLSGRRRHAQAQLLALKGRWSGFMTWRESGRH